MKIAVVGSRCITAAYISVYVSDGDEIVSGGAPKCDSPRFQKTRTEKRDTKSQIYLSFYCRQVFF